MMSLPRVLKAPPNALTLWRSQYAQNHVPPYVANFVISDVTVRFSDGK